MYKYNGYGTGMAMAVKVYGLNFGVDVMDSQEYETSFNVMNKFSIMEMEKRSFEPVDCEALQLASLCCSILISFQSSSINVRQVTCWHFCFRT